MNGVKILKFILFFGLILGSATVVQAYPITITDNYVGATPTHSSYTGRDVIGEAGLFDISRMEVSYSGSTLTVDIFSRYLNNVGAYSTALGDLFISTDGWNPAGTAPYAGDNFSNGEQWEFALDLVGTGTQGDANLFATNQGAIGLSDAPPGYIYRDGQEAFFSPFANADISALGSWAILGLASQDDTDDYLRLVINNWNFGTDLGFHWTMSCGNDVIEGGASIPEPSTLLLGSCLFFGLTLVRRRRHPTSA
jgi:hypothetical protein